jgi:RNA polymerase sporulation-specific sigma factor
LGYKELNDYELVYQVRENDAVAYNLLIEKYSNLVDMLAKKYIKVNKDIGIEYDDLYQEGMLGFFKALDDYNSNDTIFYTYALLCSRREMLRLIKTFKRKKQMVLNESISINRCVNNKDDLYIEDILPSNYNLEDDFYSYDTCQKLINFKYNLTFEDSLMYELKLNDFSISEIATLLDISYKKVDNHLNLIKKKLLQII